MQKKEGAPLYLQIYKELQKRIENGVYKENELLPSEASLQAEFNVSRITIRRSLQDLELQEGADIYRLKRLRLKNGRIIGMNEQFISRQTGFELHADVLNEKTSIYALYEEQGLHIERAVESIEAVMPSTALRKELYMNEGEPLFRRERITYDYKNRPLELSINSYKADEYKYIITLKKDEL